MFLNINPKKYGHKNTIGSLDHDISRPTNKQESTDYYQSSADKLFAVITAQIKSKVNNRITK